MASTVDAPPYTFVAKTARVSWDSVLDFDATPFTNGTDVSPRDLNALDNLARRLEEAKIEPQTGVEAANAAANLAKLASILQLSSEYQAMRAEDLQAAVAKKDEELDMMDEQMEVMEQRGGRSDPRLEAENEELKIRAEQAERRLAEQRDELAVTQEQLDRAKRDVRDEKSKTEVALQKAKHAEDDVKELVEQIAAERQKNVRAAKDDSLAGSRLQQRNQDVARYQKENKLLADENDRMNMRIEDLMAECVEMSETIVKLDDAAQAWRGREADVEAAADGLRRERDKLAAQLETTKMDLEERTHLLQDLEIKFKEEYERFEREKEDLMIDAKRARHGEGVDGARGFDAGSGRSDLVSPRRRMQITRDPRRPANPDDPRYVEDLEAEVAELRDLRVLLLEAYDQLEHDVGREIDIALKRQRRQHDALHDKLAAQDEALDIETKRFRSIDKELTHAQEDLAEANERCKKYEAGVYGLSDAMRDLKQTRLRVRAADAQVEDAVALSNQLGRKVEDLIEETRYLRQKAGIPEDATLDLGGFKLKSQVESAQMRALNAQLEREVADLEEDRRRLRNELRYRAKWQGEHAARLGLSARQLGMLEEYADALRYGDDALFNDADDAGSHPGFRASQGIGARAIRELEDANKTLQQRLAEALDRLQRGETGAGGISMPLIAAGSYGGGDHSQVAELQSQLARARAEIVRLEDGYNVAMMRSSVQGALVGSGGGGGVASVAASPAAAARAPDSPPRGAATAAAAAAAAAAPGAAVDASAYAEALETIDRLRGERNALHARAQSLQSMIDAAPATMGVGASGVVAGVGGADYGASTDVQKMREECVAADRALAGVVAELQTKERELDELAHETAKYKTGIAELQAVRTALYREHVRARNAWSEERKTLLERAKRAETEAEANRIEAKDATALCERLKPGAESGLKEALSAAHSRLAVLQVREVRLSRAVEAATSAEASFRAEKEELEIDVQEMSRACQERLAFHERRAAEAELRAARCQRELDLCVPRPEHAAVVDANRALQVRFKELLETRVKSAVSSAQLKAAQEDAVTARAQADAASAANAAAQNRVRELSAALDDAADRAGREGLAASAVELRREVAETRAELEASKRLADLAKRESERLTESKADLESAVLGLEHQLAEAKARVHEAQEAERKHLSQLAVAVSEDKHRAEMEAVAAAEDEAARLRAEVVRAEDRAARAETELGRKNAAHAARDAELLQLRSAVRDMERRSDAAAALARANEDVVRLKGGNAQLKHQVQVAEAEADRLHGDCLRLHRRAQVQENRLYGLREDSRGLMQAQEAALARLETAVAGRVDASEAEKWERAILDLRKGAERREELLRRAQETLRGAAERARAAELELTSLKNIDRVAREHDGGSPDAAMREIRKLSDELMRAKLAAARAERAAKQANDRAEYLETRERERELETRQMEERALIDKRADADRAEEFSRKVRELQREILTARNVGVGDAKKDGANASATATGAADADDADAVLAAPLPRRRANAEALAAVGAAAAVGLQPGATSMETQRMVLRQIEAIRALKLRATEAEAKCARATEEARAAAAAVQNAENERDAVQRRLDATIAAGTGADGEHGTGATGDDSAVAQVTAVAQATIARLQELVGEKNAALTRAQAAMSDLRADALSKQDEDRRTIEKLNDLLFKQDQHKIDAMKEQLEYGGVLGGGGGGSGGGRTPSKSGAGGGRGKFADKSHEQLLALLSEREQAIEVLTQRFEQQRARHEVSEARLLARAQQKEGEMDRVVAEIDRERARGPSRVLETLVARLKTQLAQKDKRLAQLKEAIRELEKKLVEAMQKQADGSIARADQRMTEVDQFKAEGADKRASTLAAQLKRAREELATAKEREALWAEERARLAAEARAARETAAKAAREAAVARSAAERTRAQSSSRAAAVAVADRAADRRDDDGIDGEVIERLSRQTADAAADAAAERERAEELEKRVAVLKTQNEKLNKLLRAEREESVAIRSGRPAERSSVSVSAATRGENEPPSGGAKESAEETRRREETLARWEEGVKLRKKAESLAKKLATRTREAEEADKLAKKRLDLLNELAKEKTALQSRAAKLAEDVKRGAGGGPDAAAAKELADENEALHREIASLQRVVEVDQAAEIAKLKRRLADTPAPAAAATTTTTGRGVTGDELDATARAAAEQRVRTLEGELLAKDDAALGLRFEAEQSHARAERLQRRLDRLFRGERERDGGDGASGVAAATRRARELEDVVEALKKVVEKQQSEIAAVRGQAAAKERGIEHARAAKELRAKVRDLEQEMVGLRQLEKTHKETTQRARRLQAQNEQFRARLQSGADAEMLAAAREDAASTALRLAETRDLLVVAQRDAAAARQDALEAMDAAVRGGGGGGGGDAAAEIAALRAENADLKVELDALDPAFFDEVMEMKRAYHEQSRTLDRYEATLADYAERLGVSFTPARRASGER